MNRLLVQINYACITVMSVPERRVHQVSLGERVQTGTDPFITCCVVTCVANQRRYSNQVPRGRSAL